MQLADIVNTRNELIQKKRTLIEEHAEALKGVEWDLTDLERREAMLLGGVDLDKITRAEHILSIRMYDPLCGDDVSAIQDAMSDLASGAKVIRERFFGTKNYDRWHHQREDHRYGYGPKHGSTVFAIGLSREILKSGCELTGEEIEAALYLLKMLEAGKYKTMKAAG